MWVPGRDLAHLLAVLPQGPLFPHPGGLRSVLLEVLSMLWAGGPGGPVNGGSMLGHWGRVKPYHLVCKASEKVRAN